MVDVSHKIGVKLTIKDFCHGLNINPLRSPPYLNCPDDQHVENAKRQLHTLEEDEAVVEFLVGVQIMVSHCKHLLSWYTAVSSEPETN
ncbi:unnamed protein product, partial [Hymenolepis diminuta]|uniref:EIF3_N domain-containing protein n=1 Tax=Hymenolepis diminuta TaxID=6216 RepID=A0A0R3SKA4_HYMDI